MKGFLLLGVADIVFIIAVVAATGLLLAWAGRVEDRRIEQEIEAERCRRQQRIAAVAARKAQERCPDYPPTDWR